MPVDFDRKYEEGKAAAKALIDSLNVMNGEEGFTHGFCEELFSSHRTLQQNVGRLLFRVVYEAAERNERGLVDDRNSGFLSSASAVKALFGVPGPYLPHI